MGRTYDGLILAELIDGGRQRETDRQRGAGVNSESPQQTWVKFPHNMYQSRRTNTAVLNS